MTSTDNDTEMITISLPGVKLSHLKRTVKFFYSGRLKVTKDELDRQHFLQYVNSLLRDVFRVEEIITNINPDCNLELPRDLDPGPPPPQHNNNHGPGHRGDGDQDNNNGPGEDPLGLFSAEGCDVQGTRQNAAMEEQESQEDPLEETDQELFASDCPPAETEEVLADGTTEIILRDSYQVTRQNAAMEEQESQKELVEKTDQELFVGDCPPAETGEVLQEFMVQVHESSSLADYTTEVILGDSYQVLTPGRVEVVEGVVIHDTSVPMEEDLVEMDRDVPTPDISDLLYSEEEEEANKLNPDWIQTWGSSSLADGVVEDEVDSKEGVSGPSRTKSSGSKKKKSSGIRRHHHIPWTITGIKRPETEAIIKEESAVYTCDLCQLRFDKAKALHVHKARSHNPKSTVPCPVPGCGKLLASHGAIKKHLLSHKPEEEWPYECPICHKKFQARGDIPKHLMTKLHEKDNIPRMGTKVRFRRIWKEIYFQMFHLQEWFDLINHDNPKYKWADMKLKIEKAKQTSTSSL